VNKRKYKIKNEIEYENKSREIQIINLENRNN